MQPIFAIALIVAASALLALAIAARSSVFGYAKDRDDYRRCFVFWFIGNVACGLLIWGIGPLHDVLPIEWVLLLIVLPLFPATVSNFQDYEPIPLLVVLRKSITLALVGAAAVLGVTLAKPMIGEWAWMSPVVVAIGALYIHLRKDSSRSEALIGMLVLGIFCGAIYGLVSLLEYLGVPI